MKCATALGGAVLMLVSLTACGGDDGGSSADDTPSTSETTAEPTAEPTEEPTDQPTDDGGSAVTGDYCADLKSARDTFSALEDDDAGLGAFDEAIGTLRQLGEEAPGDIADDWQVLIGGLDTFQGALADAGLTLQDLADPQALQDLDPQALQDLTQQLESLDSKQFDQAADAIAQQAKADCGFDLDGS